MSRSRQYLRELCRHAESLGWIGQRTGGNHIRWTHPGVPGAIVISSTPKKDCLGIEKSRFTKGTPMARPARK